jgi:hypothetical protein
MRSVNAIKRMLEQLVFSEVAATYFIATCGVDSLGEIAYLDGSEDVDAVNTSGKAGAQIPQLPLGDDSPPCGR